VLARKSCGKPRATWLAWSSWARALYPAIIDHFAKRQPGWQVELRSFGWRRDERRPAVRDFVRACRDAAGT
jgi:hypothetical protein